MARPQIGVDIEQERALTRFVCQRIYLASGLTYRQIEEGLMIGAIDHAGRRTGRTFSRYCQDDGSKSRAASRDSLAQIVKNSIKKGWVQANFLRSIGGDLLTAAIPLDLLPSDSFAARKNEVDALVSQVRKLREEAKKTAAILRALQHCKIQEQADENDPFWPALYQFIGENHLHDPECKNADFCPPVSIIDALDWLEFHLNSANVCMADGFETMPKPRFKTTALAVTDPLDPPDPDIEKLIAELIAEAE